jgi:RND family efflux transporter MFP subunit
VKKGQPLADLDAPDLDGQLQAAQANLANAKAAQKLSAATDQRWAALFGQGAVARQDKDEKDADLAAKNAAVAAAAANVYSLRGQAAFKHLVAPFDGIITSRSVDTGALVTVGNASATPLFTVTDQTKLRVYVRVPQNYAGAIHPGTPATFTVPEIPGRTFQAAVMASAQAINTATGTTLVQLQIDNKDGALRPGAYAQVRFDMPAQASAVRVPATALMVREDGPSVATVSPAGRVVITPITISRDLGTAVEVGSGLKRGDRVIDNPSDSLAPGDLVHVRAKGPGA